MNFLTPCSFFGPGVFLRIDPCDSQMSKKSIPAVGFPPPLLGEDPIRLPILRNAEGWIAIEKPSGVGMRAHPWDEGVPDLDTALNAQLDKGKPELLRLGASVFGSIYYMDPEISGIAVFAKNREALADLRNRYGSGEGRFVFTFVAGCSLDGQSELESDAPLLHHRVKPKMIPSTAKGKKCFTRFKCLAEANGWGLWEAHVDFFRAHQVRAHAAVAGIPPMGDTLYSGPAIPTHGQLEPKKRRQGPDKPAFVDLPIWLSRVELSEAELIDCPASKHLSRFIQRLGLSYE